MNIRSRRESVTWGEVETVYSIVVGDGLRVRRWGCVVSIASCCLVRKDCG